MAAKSKKNDVEGDPKRGDEILKRMLQSKPRPHNEMKKVRKGKSNTPGET